ncbi:MAG: sigma 54-interacting transcriptional regulator [Gemmatales bacterium]|nr:sigma 54-interacting transcriptional regulator [Gemmatales bacterium]MDW8175284.1 sigma 54-interacting transcriptional regulator [Gemmatales bacterium]
MGSERTAYLVVRRHDGLGNVYPLEPAHRHLIGRAKTSEIVLADDLCSRQHAEVYYREGGWRIRDCGSLNGTRVNGQLLTAEYALCPNDEVQIGRTRLVFVERLDQLEQTREMPVPVGEERLLIRRRLGRTRYELTDLPDLSEQDIAEPPTILANRQRISRDLSLLYRLALEMGMATNETELARVVLNGLLEATLADAAVLYELQEGRASVLAHQERTLGGVCPRMPDFVLQEVLKTREAIFAEHPRRLQLTDRDNPHLPQSRSGSGPISALVCAPVVIHDRVELVILVCVLDPLKSLTSEDLDVTVALGKQLAVAWQAVRRQQELAQENKRLRDQVLQEVRLVGESPGIQEVKQKIQLAARSDATVLIRGETGVGKELVARAIHLCSSRAGKPFVCLNCAALAESLLESELFGHEKGAFTGATERKIGKFESAHQGTIFLDEIGEMTPSAQAKLLRILEGHPFERVGGSQPIRVNVRVVAATNRSLEEAIQAGRFRLDLYYRLQVIEIMVPPLRERREDIPLLADFFLRQFAQQMGRRLRGFTPAALKKLQEHNWPGNVRELRNVIERAVVLSHHHTLDADDIWLAPVRPEAVPAESPQPVYEPITLEELEKRHILATLEHTRWNKSQAARILGIERSTLDRKIHAYGLQKDGGKESAGDG